MESKLSSCLLCLCFVLAPATADGCTMELDMCLELEARLARQLLPVEGRLKLERLLAHMDKCAYLVCVALDTSQIDKPLISDVLFAAAILCA